MKAMEVLRDSDDLAEFANLKTHQDAINFQQKTTWREGRTDFAPASWWGYDHDGYAGGRHQWQWQYTQRLLREEWAKQFQSDWAGLYLMVQLLFSVFEP